MNFDIMDSKQLGLKLSNLVDDLRKVKLNHTFRNSDLHMALRLLEPVSISLTTGNVLIMKDDDVST